MQTFDVHIVLHGDLPPGERWFHPGDKDIGVPAKGAFLEKSC